MGEVLWQINNREDLREFLRENEERIPKVWSEGYKTRTWPDNFIYGGIYPIYITLRKTPKESRWDWNKNSFYLNTIRVYQPVNRIILERVGWVTSE